MTKLVILGAGGHGAVVADAAMLADRWSEILFLDDDQGDGSGVLGCPIADITRNWAVFNKHGTQFVVAIGDNRTRLGLLESIERGRGALASVVHPSAVVSPFASIGVGVVIFAAAVVNPRTKVSMGSIINTGATIDHDSVLGRAVHVSPGAHVAGQVHIGDRSWLGIGSSVREGVRIGDDAVVGAGAAVVCDVPSKATVVGVPARPIEL